jgi:hypothetical protein
MQAIKRILRYLAGATNSGLYYPSHQIPTFAAFSDSDWASAHKHENFKLASLYRQQRSSALDLDQTTHDLTF